MVGLYYKISFQMYKDNYEEGEVENTFSSEIFCEKHIFGQNSDDLISQAIDFILKKFSVNSYEVDENKIYIAYPLQIKDEFVFRDATEEEIQKWKNNMIDLYNKELIIEFFVMNEVDSENLKNTTKKRMIMKELKEK